MNKLLFSCIIAIWFLMLWSMHLIGHRISAQQVVIDHLLDAVIILQESQAVENNYILNWVQEQRAIYDNATAGRVPALLEVR